MNTKVQITPYMYHDPELKRDPLLFNNSQPELLINNNVDFNVVLEIKDADLAPPNSCQIENLRESEGYILKKGTQSISFSCIDTWRDKSKLLRDRNFKVILYERDGHKDNRYASIEKIIHGYEFK